MSNIEKCQFYCLSYNNKERKTNMVERFKTFDIDCRFYSGVNYDDKRIPNNINNIYKRLCRMTYGHLDIIHDFYYSSDTKYAVICEDDIHFHKDFKELFNKVFLDFNMLNLDVLLLGYLLPYKIGNENVLTNFTLKKPMSKETYFKYHDYPDYLSGTHMYMISKKYARYLLKTYYRNYLEKGDKHFTPDKILIKDCNKALIYPMLAIENDEQEDLYHQLCHNIHCSELYC